MAILSTDEQPLARYLNVRCDGCLDTGVSLGLYGPERCTACGEQRRTPAAARFADRVWQRVAQGLDCPREVLHVARIIVNSTPDHIVTGPFLVAHTRLNERDIKGIFQTLRRDWLLPFIASRRPPYGYTFANNAAEFEAWFSTIRAQAVSEFATAYRLMRANYPQLAGQGAFDFDHGFRNELAEVAK